MKSFTHFQDAFHAVTNRVQSGVKRLLRSLSTTRSAWVASEARSKPKPTRKRYPWRHHRHISDQQTSKGSLGQTLAQVSALDFASVGIAEAVPNASSITPVTGAETQPFIQEQADRTHSPVARRRVPEWHQVPSEIWTMILDHGIQNGGLSFLLNFRSLSRAFNAFAQREVPLRVAMCLKDDEGDVLALEPDDDRPGSWVAVLKRSTSTAEYNDFLLLQCAESGSYPSLSLIAAASVRQPTSLIIKEIQPYGQGHYISISFNNRIQTRPLYPALTLSVVPNFVGWNSLEELILECPISIGDALYLLTQINCSNSLRTLALNIRNLLGYDANLDPSLFTAMTHLRTLILKGSLLQIDTVASYFTFPTLQDLALTILGSQYGNAGEMVFCELRFPWSQLEQLTLRNAHTSLADVHAVLSQCHRIVRFIWDGSLLTAVRPQQISLLPLEQVSLEGSASDCEVMLISLKNSLSWVCKLALSHYRPSMELLIPQRLEEFTVCHPVQNEDLLLIFNRLRKSLIRGKFAVLAPTSGLQLIFPAQPAVVMKELKYLCLQANHVVQPLLSALIAQKMVRAEVRPLPYHLS